MARLITQI